MIIIGNLSVQSVAGQLAISPTRVDLDAKRVSAAVKLTNAGQAAVVVQAGVLRWLTVAGKDRYEPTTDLVVTPPIATVPPHGIQIFRVGFRRPPEASRKSAYRLILQEVPKDEPMGRPGVRIALRMSVPVHVGAPPPP